MNRSANGEEIAPIEMPPNTTLWPLERHTEAKHRVLKRYLEAWLPIVCSVRGQDMWLVDGFAGPGQYLGGEPGSPIHMINAYINHKARDRIDSMKTLRFVFIEKDPRRVRHLKTRVRELRPLLGSNSTVQILEGDFGDIMPDVSAAIEAAPTAVPAFLFVDPFGYEETDPKLTTRLLALPHCETLTFLPIEHIARFVTDERLSETLNNLFRGDRWRSATALVGLNARIESLRQSYADMLHTDARWVRSFRIRSDSEFALFFATNHELGLTKMKESMWTVDPVGGTNFADSTSPGQDVLFADADVSGVLEAMIRRHTGWTRYDVLERELMETAYLPKHLKAEILRLQGAGGIQVIPPSQLDRPQPGTLIQAI